MRGLLSITALWAFTLAFASAQLSVSQDGQCGAESRLTCIGSDYGECCSEHGWCGNSSEHCGPGCQLSYGFCSSFWGNSTYPQPTSPPVFEPPPQSGGNGGSNGGGGGRVGPPQGGGTIIYVTQTVTETSYTLSVITQAIPRTTVVTATSFRVVRCDFSRRDVGILADVTRRCLRYRQRSHRER